MQRRPEERGQVVLFPADRHSPAYLVKVEVAEERRLPRISRREGRCAQNADNRHGKLTTTESVTR
jgi:hypothetical protein